MVGVSKSPDFAIGTLFQPICIHSVGLYKIELALVWDALVEMLAEVSFSLPWTGGSEWCNTQGALHTCGWVCDLPVELLVGLPVV